MRIVVVEDSAKIRRGVVNLIHKISSNYHVIGEAANGSDGMNMIAELKPDLVIADIRMPELNGLEMLQSLKDRNIKHKTIILSAYSDFSFAQQAIGIGVSDYLLKPVTAEKLFQSLTTIERELEDEFRKNQLSGVLIVRHMLHELMLGKNVNIGELQHYLKLANGFDGIQPFALVTAYTGNNVYDRDALQQVLSQLFSENPEYKYFLMDIEINGMTVGLVFHRSGILALQVLLTNEMVEKIHSHDFPNLVMGWIPIDNLEKLHSKLHQMNKMMKWAIVLGKDSMITQSTIDSLEVKPLEYPDELEKQAVAEVSRRHFQSLGSVFEEFFKWWVRTKYLPEQIEASFVRFASSIMNAVKEMDLDLFKRLKQQEILHQIMGSVTLEQLEVSLNELLKRLGQTENAKTASYSLPVTKIIKCIADNYHMGITREETASRLHITPEYLSMLFYKEVGQSFSAYLKQYRINKAKELLLNTELKIFEVAERVGYPDPKYFCRVFKEVAGVPASEYQNIRT